MKNKIENEPAWVTEVFGQDIHVISKKEVLEKIKLYLSEGGPGSGNFGHAGRPGMVGGSATSSGGETSSEQTSPSSSDIRKRYEYPDEEDEFDNFDTGMFYAGNRYGVNISNYSVCLGDFNEKTRKFANFWTEVLFDREKGGGKHADLLARRFNRYTPEDNVEAYVDKKTGDVYNVVSTDLRDRLRYVISLKKEGMRWK